MKICDLHLTRLNLARRNFCVFFPFAESLSLPGTLAATSAMLLLLLLQFKKKKVKEWKLERAEGAGSGRGRDAIRKIREIEGMAKLLRILTNSANES